ncbi:exosortase N [Spirosoma flavum]|uniref:Exosortase N n=1 Tax=Spirosoma flavum TaxID=2048557 RepID=A0ABW6ADY6_9BACT
MLSLDLTTLLSIALLVFASWPGTSVRSHWTGRLLTLLLLSPGLRYFSALFTFPIRLQLSEWAGNLLRLAGLNVQVEGNILINNGIELAVDPACTGLQLTGVSLLLALFMLIWQERQAHKSVSLLWVFAYGLFVLGLTILCNLFRIMLLVAFGAMPGTWAHEGIGLACVAVYTWLPMWAVAGVLVQRLARTSPALEEYTKAQNSMNGWRLGWGTGLLTLGLVVLVLASRPVEPGLTHCRNVHLASIAAGWYKYGHDCQCKTLATGLLQLAKPGILIYLKPQPDWFSADHNPIACWRGSGYELRRIRETVLDGHPAYIGELRKKGKVLHTVWWFSNGAMTTISQLSMRTQMLRGKTEFMLVNVTVDKAKYPFDFE